MPSFDIVSQIDLQEVDNAFNQAKKEMDTRYDFRGQVWELDFNRKDQNITLTSENDMLLKAMKDIMLNKAIKRKIDTKALKFDDPKPIGGNKISQTINLQSGIDKETAKKITKEIKNKKLKVNAQIQEDQVRVTGKKRDDLQEVISHFKESSLEIPLQYINFRD